MNTAPDLSWYKGGMLQLPCKERIEPSCLCLSQLRLASYANPSPIIPQGEEKGRGKLSWSAWQGWPALHRAAQTQVARWWYLLMFSILLITHEFISMTLLLVVTSSPVSSPLCSRLNGTAIGPLFGSCWTVLEAVNKYVNICLVLFCPVSSECNLQKDIQWPWQWKGSPQVPWGPLLGLRFAPWLTWSLPTV